MNRSAKYSQIDASEGKSLYKGEEFQQAHAVVWMTLEDIMLDQSGEMRILAWGARGGAENVHFWQAPRDV